MATLTLPAPDITESKMNWRYRTVTHEQIKEIEEKRQMINKDIRNSRVFRDQMREFYEALKPDPLGYIRNHTEDEPNELVVWIRKCEDAYKDLHRFFESLRPEYRRMSSTLGKKLQTIIDLTYEIVAFLQEIRWWITVALANKQQRGPNNSAKVTLANLWD